MNGANGLLSWQGPQGFVNGQPVMASMVTAAQKFAVSLNSYEALSQSLYDSAAYVTAGVNQLTFFQYQIGAGTGVISNTNKTAEDTNMQAPGALPAQQGYIVAFIEVEFQPGVSSSGFAAGSLPSVFGAQAVASAVNDTYKFRCTGYLNFNISSKSYMQEGPLMKFPASNDFGLDAALADVSTAGASFQSRMAYGKAIGPSYQLAPNNLFLIPTMNFNVTLNWATVETVTAAARVFVRLMGQLIRPAQ
jgi:hypothetical protein